jgi:hypothetical protein
VGAAAPPRRGALAALLALQLVWGAVYVLRTGYVVAGEPVFCLWDDAMISMRYARNLAEGHGLVWNAGGERVQGFSNPGVTLAMAALHALPVAPERASLLFQALELALLAASLALVWRIARELFPERPVAAPAAALAVLACAPHQLWALQGSDTGAVGAWLLACLAWLAAQGRERWPARLPLLLAAGALLRLDASVLAAAVAAVSLGYPGARARRLALSLAPLALVCAAWLGVGWLYYGDPLPNTWYLKASGSPRALVLRSGAEQLLARLPGLAPALAAAAFSVWRRRGDPRVLALAAAVAAGLAYDVWAGGDWVTSHGSRFSTPVLAPLLLLAADGACALAAALVGAARPVLRAAAALVLAVALGALASPRAALVEWLDPRAPTLYHAVNGENLVLAAWLRKHTQPDTSLGVHWGGVPPYFSGRPAVDLLGRSDRHIAHLAVNRFVPGHSKWDWEYVLHVRRPDLILGESRGLVARSDFRALYVEARSREGPVFFVRRESTAKLSASGLGLFEVGSGRPAAPANAPPAPAGPV